MTKDQLLIKIKSKLDAMQYSLSNCKCNTLGIYYSLRNDLNNDLDDYFVQFMKDVQE